MPSFSPVIEEDFLRSQAALLDQVNNLQPLLDSPHIKGKSFNTYHRNGPGAGTEN